MHKVLIVSSSTKNWETFRKLLNKNNYSEIVTVLCAAEAKRLVIEKDFDLVLIDSPLQDESGIPFAKNIMSQNIGQVVLLVPAIYFEEISDEVEDIGIFTVSKPINKALFWNILKLCSASTNRMKLMQKENLSLVQKLDDIKLIHKAKCLLIEYDDMTETQAHKFIERRAMDTRATRREIAKEIIDEYESI
jgi:response regulator NasT